MNESEIDDAILAVVGDRWQKVAMVIVTAADSLRGVVPEGEAGYPLIADRIGILVQDGRLVAQGNTARWRHSEVRQA